MLFMYVATRNLQLTRGAASRRPWRTWVAASVLAVVMLAGRSVQADAAFLPPAPAGLVATAVGSSEVDLTWNAPLASAPSGLQLLGYDVYQGTSSGGEAPTPVGPIAETSYTASSLASGTTYYFYVTAVYQSCSKSCVQLESSPSNEEHATTSAPTTLPAPTGLTVAATGGTSVTLTWQAPVGGPPVTGYDIYEGTSSGAEGTSPVGSVAGTSYTITGLASGTTYFFRVTAVSANGQSQPSNETAATPAYSPPSKKAQTIRLGPFRRHHAGATFRVSASASSGLVVLLSSETPRICTVSGATITTRVSGTCTIEATQDGNALYQPAAAVTQSFTVSRPARSPAAGHRTLAGLLAAVILVGLLALAVTTLTRRRRIRSRLATAPRPVIRAELQADRVPRVRVRTVGPQPTQTVRVEPHSGPANVTIKEVRT